MLEENFIEIYRNLKDQWPLKVSTNSFRNCKVIYYRMRPFIKTNSVGFKVTNRGEFQLFSLSNKYLKLSILLFTWWAVPLGQCQQPTPNHWRTSGLQDNLANQSSRPRIHLQYSAILPVRLTSLCQAYKYCFILAPPQFPLTLPGSHNF